MLTDTLAPLVMVRTIMSQREVEAELLRAKGL